ncbi:amino acid transporter domain-containing protein [Chloropicon primus]|uniref:Amino acid transporter transmembrane domain-containing protein n=1 Tax=Chloropicon primus TaxID=1764295 RepID=A0A5B8MGJ6_9CHLO|nr:hypothetical protein A3770_03p20710 [Chloropicon primus]UPQ98765.1 amino acid transporter domain-containing protein [Chloropicon primus]|eukprot:QDZ19553.1 hypothetical protein A3770_03p20710 [Chloropicon primus]
MEEKKTTPLRPVASSSHKPKQKSGGGLTCIDELTTTPSPSEEGSRRSGASEGPTLSQRDRTSGTLTWRSIRSAQDSPTREYAREGSKGEGETSLRLNPAIVKRKGIKLLPKASSGSTKVVEELGSGKAIACPDDESLRLEVGEAKESDRGIFGGMFNGSPGGCMGGGCVPAMLFKGSSKSSEASHVNMEPLSRDATLYTRETNKMPPKRTKWWQVTLYIINDTIGAWLILYSSIILGMYGWILGIVLLLALWPLNLYAAHLLWRCRNVFPGAISIGDLVYYVTKSPIAMYATFFFVNATILLTLASQIDSAASNIYWFFSEEPGSYSDKCLAAFLGGVCVVLLPLTQLRYLHSLTLMNVVNITAMLVFVLISVYMVVTGGRHEDANTRLGPNTGAILASVDFDDEQAAPLLGIDILVTAYYYQLIILEIIAEMKHTKEFPKANYWSTPAVLFVAVVSACTQYYFQGEEEELKNASVQQVLTSIFDYEERGRTALAYVAVICFSIHMIGCCVIRAVVITRSCHLLINPAVANKESWRSRLEWAGISLVVLLLAWTLTLFIRFLSLMSLLNGVLVVLTSIVLPIVLYILCCKKRKTLKSIPVLEWGVMGLIVLLSVASIVIYIVRLSMNGSSRTDETSSTMDQVRTVLDCTGFKITA